jgi:murein L,D-transpeptidase YafK
MRTHVDVYAIAVIFPLMNRISIIAGTIFFAVLFFCTAQGKSTFSATISTENVAAVVPAHVLQLPESVAEVLIADAKTSTLYRFGKTTYGLAKIDQRYMSIGRNGVGKEKAWDRKTPLGIYFITEKLDTSNLHEKYGIAAYPLDYPNAWDRYNQRTGDGIWLHGVTRNSDVLRPPRDTDGCLALPNDELFSLMGSLKPLVTPVIVARELKWATPSDLEDIRIELHIALQMWRQSLEEGDFVTHLSLYSDEFMHHGMNKDAWASYRLDVFDTKNFESVNLKNVMLLADPEELGLYLSRFTQELVTDGEKVTLTKRLYWKHREDNLWQIVAEDSE